MFGRKSARRHAQTLLTQIWVDGWDKQYILDLPSDCKNWEIIGGEHAYHAVKFLAIREDGSIGYITEFASGQWKRYTAK